MSTPRLTPELTTGLDDSALPPYQAIQDWFASDLGRHVFDTELAMLDQLLPSLFGYHLAQLSVQGREMFAASSIQTKVLVNLTDAEINTEHPGVVASPAALPLQSDSIDVVLLHHLLDFVESPQDVLREVERVTLPSGNLIIMGFNPISLWGMWQPIARFRGKAPWSGSFIRPGRLMDWLNLLNFKIDRAQYAIYRPPMARYTGRVEDYSQGFSRNLNLPIGSVYVIVAKKQVGGMTPIRPVWKTQRTFGRLSVVRSVKHDGVD